jgi:hypothetical protein
VYLLGTLPPGLSPSKTSCFMAGSITSLRIKCAKGSSSKEKVVELDEMARAGEGDRPCDGDLRVLRDMLLVRRWIIISYSILWSDDKVANSFNCKKKKDKCNYVWFHTASAILQYDPMFGRIILGGVGIGRVGVGVARLLCILSWQSPISGLCGLDGGLRC